MPWARALRETACLGCGCAITIPRGELVFLSRIGSYPYCVTCAGGRFQQQPPPDLPPLPDDRALRGPGGPSDAAESAGLTPVALTMPRAIAGLRDGVRTYAAKTKRELAEARQTPDPRMRQIGRDA